MHKPASGGFMGAGRLPSRRGQRRLTSVTDPAEFDATVLDATGFRVVVSDRELRTVALREQLVADTLLLQVMSNRL